MFCSCELVELRMSALCFYFLFFFCLDNPFALIRSKFPIRSSNPLDETRYFAITESFFKLDIACFKNRNPFLMACLLCLILRIPRGLLFLTNLDPGKTHILNPNYLAKRHDISVQRSIACILWYQKAVDTMENALLRTASYFKRTGLVAVLYLLFTGMPKSLTASSARTLLRLSIIILQSAIHIFYWCFFFVFVSLVIATKMMWVLANPICRTYCLRVSLFSAVWVSIS